MSSYFDWLLEFRKSGSKDDDPTNHEKDKKNSLNIKEKDFKDFVRKWREKNKI